MSHWIKRIVSILLALALVVGIGGFFGYRIWLKHYLQSEAARQRLNALLSSALKAEVEVAPLQLQTLDAIYSEHLTATRHGFPFLRADQLRADVRLGWRSSQINRLDLTQLQIHLDSQQVVAQTFPSAEPRESDARFHLARISAADFSVGWPGGRLEKSHLLAEHQSGGRWRLLGEGGRIQFDFLPGEEPWTVRNVEATLGERGDFNLRSSLIHIGENGKLNLEGEFLANGEQRWQATYAGIPAERLLKADWRARLTGQLSGMMTIFGSAGGALDRIEGHVELSEGELSALPVLETLASVTGTDHFRRMRIHTGRAKIRRAGNGGVELQSIYLESKGLMRVEGDLVILNGQVEGTVMLGLTPGTLALLPGSRETFTKENEGYLWTPVRLSGPIATPMEDLSPRLAKGAIKGTIRETRGVIEKTSEGVIDAVAPLVPLLPF